MGACIYKVTPWTVEIVPIPKHQNSITTGTAQESRKLQLKINIYLTDIGPRIKSNKHS